jgi:ATP-binding cassette subfamily F protein 3
MIAAQLDNISIGFGAEPIFEGLSWQIHDDRKVGLVGANGSGKSTLLKLIAGVLTCDQGAIMRRKGLTIGYLAQEPLLDPNNTLWDEVQSASTELAYLEAELTRVEAKLADPQVYGDAKNLTRALELQAKLLKEYTRLGGPSYTGLVRSTLIDLGFAEVNFQLPVTVLSGGEKKLVGLAKLLVTKPNLLLLDEPDNHLDLEGKARLEKIIRTYQGGVVIVSHDRYLLDLVVEDIAEMENGTLTPFTGGYSEYAFEKETHRLRQQQLFQAQQKEINRLEQAAKRLLTWGKVFDNEKFSKRGMNILNRLERMERIDKPFEQRAMRLALKGARSGEKVIEIEHLAKAFPHPADEEKDVEATILAGVDLLIRRGERIGLVGPNGAGKSLLFRLILGQESPSAGEIKIGPSIKVGYYAQQHETLEVHRSLIDNVRNAARFTEEAAVAFLQRFLFTYAQARAPVSHLSGGERSRLQMALLMLAQPNLLLLDEPTNNLDIASIEALEGALDDFEGAVFVISHDRYFLDRVVQRVVELDQGLTQEYLGNYSDYMSKKGAQ